MKKLVFSICFYSCMYMSFSQVGIGNTNPDASSILDISAIDKGVLIPRVALNNVTTTMLDGANTSATGLLIYNTNAAVTGGDGVGYYYFNGTIWERLTTSATSDDDSDWYEEGTTTSPNNINDDMFTQGNVAIGKTTADFKLDIEETTGTKALNISVGGTLNDDIYGNHIQNSNSGTGLHFGSYYDLTGVGAGGQFGTYQDISNTGSGSHYGSFNLLRGTGAGVQTGSNQSITNTGSGFHYGSFNWLSGAGTGEQYGIKNIIENSGNALHYGVYNTLTGNGAGTHYGTFNALSGSGDGILHGNWNLIANSGNGSHYGVYNSFTGNGSGIHNGVFNIINGSGSAQHIGVSNDLRGTGNGNQLGIQNAISNSGSGIHYGMYNSLSGIGSGFKYGVYSFMHNTAGGTHYGVYSEALKVGSYAGYFLGNVSVGTTTANNYIFPVSRGTNGQVMQTDGSGNMSWTTPLTGDIEEVIAGNGLVGGAASGVTTLDVVATNGLTNSADDIKFGGTLIQNTTINQGTFGMSYNLDSTGDFNIQDAGVNHFQVSDNGVAYFGDDTYWNDGSTAGTTLARLYDNVNDGVFDVYSNGAIQHSLNTVGTSVFNEQGTSVDFRIESDTNTAMFFVDASTNRIGIGTSVPVDRFHVSGGRVEFTNTNDASGRYITSS